MPEREGLEPGEDGKLHINDMVGPDEYKEHVDDNAFTNCLVWWTIGKAIEYSGILQQEKPLTLVALLVQLFIIVPRIFAESKLTTFTWT